jgi:hypothetical protein
MGRVRVGCFGLAGLARARRDASSEGQDARLWSVFEPGARKVAVIAALFRLPWLEPARLGKAGWATEAIVQACPGHPSALNVSVARSVAGDARAARGRRKRALRFRDRRRRTRVGGSQRAKARSDEALVACSLLTVDTPHTRTRRWATWARTAAAATVTTIRRPSSTPTASRTPRRSPSSRAPSAIATVRSPLPCPPWSAIAVLTSSFRHTGTDHAIADEKIFHNDTAHSTTVVEHRVPCAFELERPIKGRPSLG